MTIRLSQQKIAKIMRCYFNGVAQPEIAKRAGVDQSTVSLYASRFRDRAGEIDLLPAGKEFGVFNEVDSLRSLAVELSKAGLTVEETKQGLKIMKMFLKLGISPEEHATLVKVCKEINDPGFVQAAIKLSRIQAENNMSYEEAVSKLEATVSNLSLVEKELEDKMFKLKSTNDSLAQKSKELKDLEASLIQLDNEAKTKAAKNEQELTAKMKQLKVRQSEVEEVARLKAELSKQGLDILTLVKLAKEFEYGAAKI